MDLYNNYDKNDSFSNKDDNNKIFDNNCGIIPSPILECSNQPSYFFDEESLVSNINYNSDQIFNDDYAYSKDSYMNNHLEHTELNEGKVNNNINNLENKIKISFQSKATTKENSILSKKIKFEETNTNNNNKKKINSKKMGRKKKGQNIIINNNEKIKLHDKKEANNIRIRYKRAFINSLRDHINKLIRISPKIQKKSYIQKIDSKYINTIKRKTNLDMLNLSAAEFFSREINKKCKNFEKDHNKELIKNIYEVQDENLTKVLNESMRNLMEIFCNDKFEDDIYKDFKLNNYIKDKLSNEDKEYIELFMAQAKNFEENIKQLKGRNENN